MTGIKKYLVVYVIGSLLYIMIVNMVSSSEITNQTNSISSLGIADVFFIFANNFLYAFLAYLLTFVGLSLILLFKIPYLIAYGPTLAGIDPIIYYVSSFTHGLAELLIGCLILSCTISNTKMIVQYAKGEVDISEAKGIFIKKTKAFLLVSFCLLMVSAIFEVYISNKLIQLFL